MTLDEAIEIARKRAEIVIEEKTEDSWRKFADEWIQVAEWLEELKMRKECDQE